VTRDIVLWAMGLVSGWILRMIVESHTRPKYKEPPFGSPDDLKRMRRLVCKKGDEGASRLLKSIQRQLRQAQSVADEKSKPHLAERLQ